MSDGKGRTAPPPSRQAEQLTSPEYNQLALPSAGPPSNLLLHRPSSLLHGSTTSPPPLHSLLPRFAAPSIPRRWGRRDVHHHQQLRLPGVARHPLQRRLPGAVHHGLRAGPEPCSYTGGARQQQQRDVPDHGGPERALPAELRVAGPAGAGAGAVACRSACGALAEYCCSGAYGSPATCAPTCYSRFFKAACPAAYSYAYDDATSTFTCAAAGDGYGYDVVFCPAASR
ncbi:hypothetical protein U9M48_026196 [Paspalum notatum var. saurae]|uniref:Thaumatin-like protein n=1 Tax=Paspalum notatum var. saurae TaxID=547442 RepID=A0AAQ3WY38_PASNO